MLIMAIKPGHDGSIAVVDDGQLLWCLESEKDTYPRYSQVTPTTLLAVAERLERVPDVIALGGWDDPYRTSPRTPRRSVCVHVLAGRPDVSGPGSTPRADGSGKLMALHRRGLINRMSDLIGYCEDRGIDDMVVGDDWCTKNDSTRGHDAEIQ